MQCKYCFDINYSYLTDHNMLQWVREEYFLCSNSQNNKLSKISKFKHIFWDLFKGYGGYMYLKVHIFTLVYELFIYLTLFEAIGSTNGILTYILR